MGNTEGGASGADVGAGVAAAVCLAGFVVGMFPLAIDTWAAFDGAHGGFSEVVETVRASVAARAEAEASSTDAAEEAPAEDAGAAFGVDVGAGPAEGETPSPGLPPQDPALLAPVLVPVPVADPALNATCPTGGAECGVCAIRTGAGRVTYGARLRLFPGACVTAFPHLVLLAAFAGFFGGCVHGLASVTTYLGNGRFRARWMLWTLVRPLLGAMLGAIAAALPMAGIVATPEAVSPTSVVVLGAVAGMFHELTVIKLRKTAVDLLGLSPDDIRTKDPIETNDKDDPHHDND